MNFDLKKGLSLIAITLVVLSSGCMMESSGEDVTHYRFKMNALCRHVNGSVPDTQENIERLEDALSQNESITVKSVDEDVLKFEIPDYSKDFGLNFTEKVLLFGNITVLDEEVKIYPKMEFTDKVMDNNFTSDQTIENKVRDIIFSNWKGILNNVERIYDVNFVSYAVHTSVVTELDS
ncbi:MAG: hypothetical protein ACLFVB_09925 [Thermoplasmata archaeon]